MIAQRPFGTLPNGRPVDAFTIDNGTGLALTAIGYGGIVTRLLVPDANGWQADVTLGYDTLEPYLKNPNFFGCIVGRTAGRTTNGRFTLDGIDYALELNGPPHHVHGGSQALHTRLWNIEAVGDDALRLTYTSPDGECGYPGTVELAVTYTLTTDAWRIDYEATTDKPTPLNLTQHAYFNLAGHDSGTVDDHVVQIIADSYAPVDDTFAVVGERTPVAGRANDLRQPRRLDDVIDHLFGRHGDPYFVNGTPGTLRPAARIYDPKSGRTMTVQTTESIVQFYTGVNMAPGTVGKGQAPYPKHAGLCLEAENYPDGVNTPSLGNIVLRPGQTYRQTTVYAFGSLSRVPAGEG